MSLSFMLIFHDGGITMTNLTEYLQFPAVMRWETNTVALGGAGGPMNVPLQQLTNRTAWLKAQVDAINLILAGDGEEPFIINYLTSESIVDALAANQGRVLKVLYDDLALALANKLDASAYNDHYKGLHISAPNLVLAYPTAQPGDYALVDTGGANDATVYFWDVEGGWVTSGSTVSLTDTDALAQGSTNLYCTNANVRQVMTRENVTLESGSLNSGDSESGLMAIASRYQLLHITANCACRFRLYTSANQRDNDLGRAIGVDPTGNHGLLFEFVTTPSLLSADLTPIVDGYSNTANIPYSVTNLSGVAQAVTVTLNHVKTGA